MYVIIFNTYIGGFWIVNSEEMQGVQNEVLEMFKELKKFIGEDICICVSNNGKLQHRIGKLLEVNSYKNIILVDNNGEECLPFIDIGYAIAWISLLDSCESIYINPNVDYGYDIKNLEMLDNEKSSFYGEVVTEKQRSRRVMKRLTYKMDYLQGIVNSQREAIGNLQSLLALEKGKNEVLQGGLILLRSTTSEEEFSKVMLDWINAVNSIDKSVMVDAYMLAISYMREISSGVLVEEIADKLDASSFTLKEVIISLIREFSLKGEEVYHSFINKSKEKCRVLSYEENN